MSSRFAFGALYALVVVHTAINVPIYLWYLHTASRRWAGALPADDSTRTVLPIAIPLAAFSFLLIAALSWWLSHAHSKPFLLARTGGRFLVAFIAALPMTAGVLGSIQRDFGTVLFTGMVTFLGMLGLWLLPTVLSPRLLKQIPRKGRSATPSETPPTAPSGQMRALYDAPPNRVRAHSCSARSDRSEQPLRTSDSTTEEGTLDRRDRSRIRAVRGPRGRLRRPVGLQSWAVR